MTDVNEFPMPFFMDTPKAAIIIANGIARDEGRIAFPLPAILYVVSVGYPGFFSGADRRRLPVKASRFKQ